MRAMAELGEGPYRSGLVAGKLARKTSEVSMTRQHLIASLKVSYGLQSTPLCEDEAARATWPAVHPDYASATPNHQIGFERAIDGSACAA